MKSSIYIFFLSIFMLANGSLFSWLFLGTPLSMWRQIIWIWGLYFLVKNYRNFLDISLNRFITHHAIFFWYTVFFSIVTIILYHFNLLRIIYAFWMYFSGLPFVLVPYLFKQLNYNPKTFYKIFIYLGLFLTIGLVIDKTTGGFFTKTFLISTASNLEGLLESSRYCFLSEAPTTFAIYYSFCMASALYLMYSDNKYKNKLTYFFIALSFFLGAFFTGSRQIVAVLGVVFAISMLYYLLFIKDKKIHILFSLIVVIIMLPSIEKFLFSEDMYSKRYNSEAIQEDGRYQDWEDGLNETILSDELNIVFFGKAVALAQGQKAQPNEITGYHYESTIYTRWSELGLYGTIFLFIPFLFILARIKNIDFFNIIIIALFSSFILICYVSPNGIHQTTQMVIYIVTGLFLCKDYFLIRK